MESSDRLFEGYPNSNSGASLCVLPSLPVVRGTDGRSLASHRYSATRAITLSILSTFFSVFDIPVFWPILVFYFCILTFITLKRQVGHMRKYK